MKIQIYEHSDDEHGTHWVKLKYDVEIEDTEIIPFVRMVLSKGVPQKE